MYIVIVTLLRQHQVLKKEEERTRKKEAMNSIAEKRKNGRTRMLYHGLNPRV